MKQFIAKLQALPEPRKKMIFFAIMAVACVAMIFVAITSLEHNVSQFANSIKSINVATSTSSQDSQPLGIQAALPATTEAPPPTDATATWKTYENKDLGFLVKYPNDYPEPSYDAKKKEVRFNDIVRIRYFKNQHELTGGADFETWAASPDSGFVAGSKQYVIIGGAASLSATEFKQSYCNAAPLLTNVVMVSSPQESFDPAQDPVLLITGPVFPCGTSADVLQRDYANFQNIYNYMLSTFNFKS